METINKAFFDYETITGMLGAMGTNLRRAIILLAFIGLIALNIATLVSSVVYDLLYKGLSSMPIAAMSDLLANSPTEKNKRKTAKLEKKHADIKEKVEMKSSSIKKRTVKITVLNVSSVAAEAIPYIGIGVILAVTALEVKAACDNMKDMDELVQSLEIEPNQEETSTVCGLKLPSIEDLKPNLSFDFDKYKSKLDELYDDVKEKSAENWSVFKDKVNEAHTQLTN